ncbi:hypothetical protein B0J18DRAFT_203962 [Chaetomium sp. MPI-SDFR-AT-0129]|nr:hypothetical protein B0J18DRAFT_203962 [Chaetomium sp. MPI-SDFR-AT-0129]
MLAFLLMPVSMALVSIYGFDRDSPRNLRAHNPPQKISLQRFAACGVTAILNAPKASKHHNVEVYLQFSNRGPFALDIAGGNGRKGSKIPSAKTTITSQTTPTQASTPTTTCQSLILNHPGSQGITG